MTTRLYLVAGKVTDSVIDGFLPAAARIGLDVVVLTDRPDDHRRRCAADVSIVECDVTDFRDLIDKIRAPAAIFSNSDHLQVPTALAAAYFGLPGKDWRAAARAKNKALMRRHLAEAGIDRVFCAEWPLDGSPPGDRPLVVKPREGVASEDVHLVPDASGLAARVADIRTRRGDPLVVEEFLPGPLYTLETLGDGRDLRVLGSFRTSLSPPPHFIEERLRWVPPPPQSGQVLAQLAELGVGFGACHTEFVVQDGRARLIEVNYRVIGDHCDLLLADLLGLPLFEHILRLHLGEPIDALPGLDVGNGGAGGGGDDDDGTHGASTHGGGAHGGGAHGGGAHGGGAGGHRRRTAIVDYVVADRPGRLTDRAPGPIRESTGGITVSYRPQRSPGDEIALTRTNRDYLGTIAATGDDAAALERAIARFRAAHSWEIR